MFKNFFILIIAIIMGGLLLSACGAAVSSSNSNTNIATSPDTDGDGIPDSAEALLGTDPNNLDTDGDGQNDKVDPNPTMADNPIKETNTTAGFTINSIVVENNVDAAAGAPDHLELALANPGATDLTNFDIYYTITDPTTKVIQGYYRTLPEFTLKAGETKSLHFDNTGQPDHFSVNPNSAYYIDKNQLLVDVTLHTKGFAPQTASVKKDAGDAETGTD